MKLSAGEMQVWSACFAGRYSKEANQGRAPKLCAVAAAHHASRAVEALRSLRDSAAAFPDDDVDHLASVLDAGGGR